MSSIEQPCPRCGTRIRHALGTPPPARCPVCGAGIGPDAPPPVIDVTPAPEVEAGRDPGGPPPGAGFAGAGGRPPSGRIHVREWVYVRRGEGSGGCCCLLILLLGALVIALALRGCATLFTG